MNFQDDSAFNPDGGFTISWRRKWDNPVFKKKQEVGVWDWMCDTAQWEPKRMKTKFGPIELERGEVVIAEREVAEEFGMHRNTLRSLLQRLVDDGMIEMIRDRIPHRAGTIVRVVKYEEYQSFANVRKFLQDRKNQTSKTEAGPKEDRSETKNKEVNKPKEEEYLVSSDAKLPVAVGSADGCVSQKVHVEQNLPAEPTLMDLPPVPSPAKPKKSRVDKQKKDWMFEPWMADDWKRFMDAYPDRGVTNPQVSGRAAFASLILKGVPASDLIEAAKAYTSETIRNKKIGTDGVKHYATFLSPAEDYWKQCVESEKRRSANNVVAFSNKPFQQQRHRLGGGAG